MKAPLLDTARNSWKASRVGKELSKLFQLADRDPIAALESIATRDSYPASPATVASYARALERVASKALRRGGLPTIQLEALIEAAKQAFVRATEGASLARPPYLTLSVEDTGAPGAGGTMTTSKAYNCPPPSVSRLDDAVAGWSKEQWCNWLNEGFNAVRQSQPMAHLAFPPLRLYPIGNYVEQLAASFSVSADFGSPISNKVVEALKLMLQSGGIIDGANDASFWRLFEMLHPRDPNVSIGRAYIARRRQSWAHEIDKETISAICSTAWDCSATPSALTSFFEWFGATVQSPEISANLIVATLCEAAAEPSLAAETIPYAASEALELFPLDDVDVSSFLADLVAAGRLQTVSDALSLQPFESPDELRLLVAQLARRFDPSDLAIWTPPVPTPFDPRVLEPKHGF